jgi:filamentous hemagglutinin
LHPLKINTFLSRRTQCVSLVPEDAATGARSSIPSQTRQVPVLDRTLPDGTSAPVKFDGIDGNVLIDRKTTVTTFPKSEAQALRQSEALQQNGLTGRWEVPNETQAARARKMLNGLGITNISVQVVP